MTDEVFEVVKADDRFKAVIYSLKPLTGTDQAIIHGAFHSYELVRIRESMLFEVKDVVSKQNGYSTVIFHGLPQTISQTVKSRPRLKGTRLMPLRALMREHREREAAAAEEEEEK